MQIKIQGTIVSPDYDDEIFASWIDKGIITPSSRFVNAIETATEPIDLYINSYGGDVFAGGEMYISAIKAAMAGKIASVEVGTLAASMAANIVASLAARGVPCRGYSNSQLMFHGCYTETAGGAQHHEDVAKSLRNINGKVIEDLNHLGVSDCRAWFNEGREMWLNASELAEMKILTGIVDGFAEAVPEMKATATRLAALAKSINSRKDYAMKLDETIQAEETKPVEAESVATESNPTPEAASAVVEKQKTEAETPTTAETVAPTADEIETKVTALANERFAGLQAKHDKMISDLTRERDAALKDLADAKAEATSLKAEVEKLTADLAATRDQLTKSEHNRESVVIEALAPAEAKFEGNAREHLAKLPPSQRQAFYKAHKAEIDNN